MDLPVMAPIAPMLAKPGSGLPPGDGWVFEPKWDGFRSIVFRDGDEVELGSRNEKPLTRYFPELVAALREALPPRCVVDGEIIVVGPDRRLDFDALQNRIHPAASRVNMLAGETPAMFVVFDLLALGDRDLRNESFESRRATLVGAFTPTDSVRLTPATTDRIEAERWFIEFEGAGCDGLIAKRPEQVYVSDKRVMVKVKPVRTADCVVAGFRWHKSGPIVGSLLLGLFSDDGQLHHVGITASFTDKRRRELVEELAPLRAEARVGHPWEEWLEYASEFEAKRQRVPGGNSRWNAKKDLSFEPLRCEWVVEVAYDHLQGNRFRHATTFRRWRTDRSPASCCYDQLEEATPVAIDEVLGRA